MTFLLQLSELAEADYAEAIAWYEGIRAGLGADLTLCIEEALDRLREFPEAFPLVFRDARRAVVWRFPYGIVFRLRGECINVEAIFHARRDPTAWQGRIG